MTDKNYYSISNYCEHSNFDIYRTVFHKLYKNGKNLCVECNKKIIKNYIPKKQDINKFRKNSKVFYANHHLTLNKKWFIINYPKEYKIILVWTNHIKNISLSERIFLFKNNEKNIPICPICKNGYLIYKNGYVGYSQTCNNPKCLKTSSAAEIEMYDYVKSLNPEAEHKFYIGRREYDIKINNLLIEFNGLYWHGDNIQKDKNYHLKKLNIANENKYELFNVWEDDWNYKQSIIKSMLNHKFGKSIKIYARNCEIRKIKTTTKDFLNTNHLQGWCQSSINLGLYYNNELVALMTFGKRKISSITQYELLRFCNKLNYTTTGGASKLFKYFIKNYNTEKIISYAAKDYSSGNLYEKIGFSKISETPVNYWWCDNNKKLNRTKFMKYKLVKLGFDENKTESEIMYTREFYKIYGCGNLKYEWIKKGRT